MASKGESAAVSSSKRPRSDDGGDDDGPTPITAEGEMPQKKFYRSRAHCNPLSHNDAFDYPVKPSLFDWTAEHYPNHPLLLSDSKSLGSDSESPPAHSASAVQVAPDVLDVGCGFGGLTIALSTLLPTHTILGIEIRAKVTEYVRLRIANMRRDNPHPMYQNCSVMRSNAMKYMPTLFRPGSLSKIFFCFPDPHFKRKNHPRRIVSERLLTEYAYFLKPGPGGGGRLYVITDVEELHLWHVAKCRAHPMFRELTEEEMREDVCVSAMKDETEEGKKVERAGAAKYYAVYERIVEGQPAATTNSTGADNGRVVTAENFWNSGEFGVAPLRDEEKGDD